MNNNKDNKDNNDLNIENTDKIDYAEINRRFREEQYFLNGQDPYNERDEYERSNPYQENRNERYINNRPQKQKKKSNYTPFLVFLISLLVIATVILAAWTLANNRRINKKLDNLDRIGQTETVTEGADNATSEQNSPSEETDATEETEETEETEPEEKETISGKLTQDLNFRSGPGYDYEVIGTVPAGAEVSGHIEQGWLKIEYNGRTGYIGPKYVK